MDNSLFFLQKSQFNFLYMKSFKRNIDEYTWNNFKKIAIDITVYNIGICLKEYLNFAFQIGESQVTK